MIPAHLWREFPKMATEFDAHFRAEADCRPYWLKARWGGKPMESSGQSSMLPRARCSLVSLAARVDFGPPTRHFLRSVAAERLQPVVFVGSIRGFRSSIR